MPATYEPISTTTLGSAASSITFSSIPATYTDLKLIVVFKANSGTVTCYARPNNDSGANYSITNLEANGSTAASYQTSGSTNGLAGNWSLSAGTTNSHFVEMDIFSYAGSTNKTALIAYSNDRNGTGEVNRNVGLYRSTSAITAISLSPNGANWSTGTTATLYGILKN